MKKLGEALTWDESADIYDSQNHGRAARTLPLDQVFNWAKKQKGKFEVSKEDTIHKILKSN